MIHASEYIEENTQGYVIYKNEVVPVTVSSVEDTSRHGSSYYIMHVKELPKETFYSMYELSELAAAKRDLSNLLQAQIDSLRIERKELKDKIKSLKEIKTTLSN